MLWGTLGDSLSSWYVWTDQFPDWGLLSGVCLGSHPARSLIISPCILWPLWPTPDLCRAPRLLRNCALSQGYKGSSGCEEPDK